VAESDPIFFEGSLANSYYRVERGLVRIYRLLPTGTRHILLFRGPGEWFGFTTGRFREEFAEAACNTRLQVCLRDAAQSPQSEILDQVLADTEKAHSRQVMLTEKDPLRRLAVFLHEWGDNNQTHPVEILVPRRDVADYLGLTVETVARCFTELRRRGVIRLNGRLRRSVDIIDREALAALCSF